MQIQLESTTRIVTVNGTEARIWEGHTASGIPVIAVIARIAVSVDQDCSEFEAELKECRPPSAESVRAIPLSMIL